MFARVLSGTPFGVDAVLVEVQCDISPGIPGLSIVGLPDKEVSEARERIRSALKNSGLPFPDLRVTVNLAPADLRKEGVGLDLALAVALLGAMGEIPQERLDGFLFLGELSLDGKLRPVRGVLPVALKAKEEGVGRMLVPVDSAPEAALVEGIEVYPAEDLSEAFSFLVGEKEIEPVPHGLPEGPSPKTWIDLALVKGQIHARRALEIAAAGGHNLIIVGPPGTGKSLLARCLPGILPGLSLEEALEVTRIYSAAGLLPKGVTLLRERPFRAPHHTISYAGMVGGGAGVPVPGEITLAHLGVLFLDELPEFDRKVLEALRQPLEDRVITITRAGVSVTFPASFTLVGAMNPCPCGYLGDPHHACKCLPFEIQRYWKKLSGPFLDRIDLYVKVPRLSREELLGEGGGEPSAEVRKRVEEARRIQRERFGIPRTNAEMDLRQVKTYCVLSPEAKSILSRAIDHYGLSARAYSRVLKVSRTIADLEGSDIIRPEHVAEALQYRPQKEVET